MKELIKILNSKSYTGISYSNGILTIDLRGGDFYDITCIAYKEPGDRCETTGEQQGSCSIDVSNVAFWSNVREHYARVDIENIEVLNELLENDYHKEF